MSDGGVAPVGNSFTVYAQTDRGGFFGLTELEAFTRLSVEPYINANPPTTLIMDFSSVRIWDIASLLWMVVGLDHFRRDAGLAFRIRLPEARHGMSEADRDAVEKSADYLRRWRFDRALEHIDSDITRLLVPDQQRYFNPPEPKRFYVASKVIDDTRLLQSLISRRLTEIRNLSDPSFTGTAPISPEKISKCIREFQAERIGDILTAQCAIEKRKSDLFSDHLLTEALLNVQEHPNATIGLISISLMGKTGELILSVVDNGESIPSTIFSKYHSDQAKSLLPSTYTRAGLDAKTIGEITDYATQPGVTRKTGPFVEKTGMGLTYIKEDTLNIFQGKLTIVSDGVKVTYTKDGGGVPAITNWSHPWRGNLLRIAIPVQRSVRPTSESVPDAATSR